MFGCAPRRQIALKKEAVVESRFRFLGADITGENPKDVALIDDLLRRFSTARLQPRAA